MVAGTWQPLVRLHQALWSRTHAAGPRHAQELDAFRALSPSPGREQFGLPLGLSRPQAARRSAPSSAERYPFLETLGPAGRPIIPTTLLLDYTYHPVDTQINPGTVSTHHVKKSYHYP